MSWKVALGLVLVSALFLVILWSGFGRDPHAVPFMLAGKPAPAFKLQRLDDGRVVTLDQLKGKPLVLNFWASWCGPCKAEQPVLEWGAHALADRAQFYGVIFEDTKDNTREYLEGADPAIVQLWDPQSQVAVDYGVAGVPETYFIDARGIIHDKVAGPLDQATLMKEVAALGAPASAEARP